MSKDIQVIMRDKTQVASKEGFGKCMYFCVNKDINKEYDISENLLEVQEDFPVETQVYKDINIFASQEPRPTKIVVLGKDLSDSENKGESIVLALNEFIVKNGNWYRFTIEEMSEEIIDDVGVWSEANKRMFYSQLNVTELTHDFSNRKRTVLCYKANQERLDVAMMGYAATRIPGEFNFKFKQLENITADDLSASVVKKLEEQHINIYINKFEAENMGTSQLNSGYVANGNHIDHYESMDWIEFRIKSEVAKLFMSMPKVPYTNKGIQMVVTSVISALDDAYSKGIIGEKIDNTPAFDVTYKTLKEIPLEYKKKRQLIGIEFQYAESGAIESATIYGDVVLDL